LGRARALGFARRVVLALVIVLLVSNQAASQTPLTREQANQVQRDCATIAQCVEAMRTETAVNFSAILEQKFAGFGEAAVPALMQVLTEDPDPRMRHYAGVALTRMPRIDVRYLPTLIEASRRGDPQPFLDSGPGWLAIPIGLVRDDPDALRYLFDLAEIYGSRASSNEVQPAIERSSRGAWMTEARRRLETFRPEQSGGFLYFLCELVSHGGWPRPDPSATPEWLEPALVRIATDPRTNANARSAAELQLRRFRNPLALEALIRDLREQLAAAPAWDHVSLFVRVIGPDGEEQWERLSDGDLVGPIMEIGRFGLTARDAAPMLRPLLSRPDLPDSRAEAALSLGLIGDQASIPELIVALNDADDWLLAYNAAEALGRLHAEGARAALMEVAHRHWSQAVRHNAERALNMLDGGAFERPDVPRSGLSINVARLEDEGLYLGHLRYYGDDVDVGADCLDDAEREVSFPQTRIETLRFPRHGAVIITPRAVSRASWPHLASDARRQMPRGPVTAIARLPGGWLVGTNAGEFIGGLAYVSNRTGGVALLVPDNIALLFRHGRKLYALTGLSHLLLSYGEVWEIDVDGDVPHAVRRIRLLAEARRILASARGDIAFETHQGTFLLGRDGALRSGDDPATCEATGR